MSQEKKGKAFASMNASEKTAYLGVKIFSDRELADRQKKAVARRTAGVRTFLESVLANPDLELGKHMDDSRLQAVFGDPINAFYDSAVKDGLSLNDLEGIMDDIIQIAYMFKRTMNEATQEGTRFVYALTGENQLGDVPLRDVIKITEVAKETRPIEADPEYANEPSLSQTEETVEDVVEAPAEAAEAEVKDEPAV